MRLALVSTFLLAVLVTWPVAISPANGLVGHPGNDVWNHVWGYWWVAEEVGAGRFPLRTDLMHFPQTSSLFFIDTFGALLTLPVQWLFGPVAAMNCTVFGCFWAAGLAAWALARHVLTEVRGEGAETDATALIASIAYGASPHLLGQAYNGITETLFAAGLPLAVLATLRLYERPGLRRAVEAALAGALCVLANWYYGLFAIIGGVVMLFAYAVSRRERIGWRALPASLAGAGVLAGVLVAPMLLAFSSTLDGDDAIVQRDPEFVWNSLISHNITDVVSLFHPGKFYSPDLLALHGEDLIIVIYLGWTLLFLAALGMRSMRRWRDRAPWLTWILVFSVLMLGPYLYVDGGYLTLFDRRIPLPFLALFQAIPAFQRISHPFRFVVPVQLGLGVLASVGLATLPRRVRPVLALVMLGEFLLGSPAPWPLPRSESTLPAYLQELAEDPVPGAVVDLPANVPNLERAVYLYYQTVHKRPEPYSLNEPLPAVLGRSHLAKAILVAEGGRLDQLPPALGDLDLVVAGRAFADLGVRYIVVHQKMYLPERLEQVVTLLRASLGPETEDTGAGELIWRLEPHKAVAAEGGS